MENEASTFKIKAFVEDHLIDWGDVSQGVKRKIFTYDERMMLVKVAFKEGAIGNLHHHYHTQISYVSKGVFEVEIDGEKRILRAGDGFHVEPDLVHGVICLEEGELIDVFSPYREDFVS